MLTYVSAGRFLSRGEWIHPSRCIDSDEIIVMTEGEASIEEDGVRYLLTQGDVLLLTHGKQHGGYAVSTKRVSFYWIHFHGETPGWKLLHLEDGYQVNLLCKQLLHYANTLTYPAEATHCLVQLLLIELAARARDDASSNSRLLVQVREWVRVNADRRITVRDVARQFGYHEDYLTRIFQEQFGVGLKQYINMERMKRIKSLLLTTEYPLKEISLLCGFSDYKGFLKYFQYHEEASPSAFRQLYFNTHMNNH